METDYRAKIKDRHRETRVPVFLRPNDVDRIDLLELGESVVSPWVSSRLVQDFVSGWADPVNTTKILKAHKTIDSATSSDVPDITVKWKLSSGEEQEWAIQVKDFVVFNPRRIYGFRIVPRGKHSAADPLLMLLEYTYDDGFVPLYPSRRSYMINTALYDNPTVSKYVMKPSAYVMLYGRRGSIAEDGPTCHVRLYEYYTSDKTLSKMLTSPNPLTNNYRSVIGVKRMVPGFRFTNLDKSLWIQHDTPDTPSQFVDFGFSIHPDVPFPYNLSISDVSQSYDEYCLVEHNYRLLEYSKANSKQGIRTPWYRNRFDVMKLRGEADVEFRLRIRNSFFESEAFDGWVTSRRHTQKLLLLGWRNAAVKAINALSTETSRATLAESGVTEIEGGSSVSELLDEFERLILSD